MVDARVVLRLHAFRSADDRSGRAWGLRGGDVCLGCRSWRMHTDVWGKFVFVCSSAAALSCIASGASTRLSEQRTNDVLPAGKQLYRGRLRYWVRR